MASPHGTPAWSSPSTQRRPVTHVQPPSMRNLHRLVFELRNLLENSGNLESALDVVDDIENALNLPPAVPIPQTSNNEPPAKLELGPLVEEALGAVSPLLEQSGVIVLRRLGAGKVVLAQRTALLRLLEDVFQKCSCVMRSFCGPACAPNPHEKRAVRIARIGNRIQRPVVRRASIHQERGSTCAAHA